MSDVAMLTDPNANRADLDAYFTERWCVEALLRRLPEATLRRGTIWEPAAGDGAIVRPLRDAEAIVFASDIEFYGFGLTAKSDFFAYDEAPPGVTGIITNPPYQKDVIDRWCRHSLYLMKRRGGFVCLLMRNEFDCAKGRRDIFEDCPAYTAKLILTKRPRWNWPGKTKDTASPRHNYAWYVWDWSARPAPPVVLYEGAKAAE